MNRISWCKAVALAGVALAALAPAPLLAEGEAPIDGRAPVCAEALSTGFDAAPEAVQAAAAACATAMEAEWGAEDPRLVALYGDLADRIAGAPKQAHAAIPLRERADAIAQSAYGPESVEAGETALDYVRTLILAGRCEGMDPVAGAYLDRARAAFDGSEDPAKRRFGLRGVAVAFADARFHLRAAETLTGLGEALDGRDWRRIAEWREAAGDGEAAEAALRAGLDVARGRDRDRILHDLRTMLFERGDFEAMSDLPEN